MSTSQEEQSLGREEPAESVGENPMDVPSMEAATEEALSANTAGAMKRLEAELAEAKKRKKNGN